MLKAVLWDMGGPIDQEIEYERLIDEDMQRALTEARNYLVGGPASERLDAGPWIHMPRTPTRRWCGSSAHSGLSWRSRSMRRWPLVATGGTPSAAGLSCGRGSMNSYGRFIAAERGWGS